MSTIVYLLALIGALSMAGVAVALGFLGVGALVEAYDRAQRERQRKEWEAERDRIAHAWDHDCVQWLDDEERETAGAA